MSTPTSFNDQRRADHLTKIARRETSRFTDDDRARVTGAVVAYLAASPTPRDAIVIAAACRLGYNAIGCTIHDLRAAEVAEVQATAEAVAAEAERTR